MVSRIESLEATIGGLGQEHLVESRALRAEIEQLRANQERMWCRSCGTVTRTQECDCTSCGTPDLQKLVNYADSRQEDIEALMKENERLRAALKTIADPNNVRLDAGARAVAEALQGVARRALEQRGGDCDPPVKR